MGSRRDRGSDILLLLLLLLLTWCNIVVGNHTIDQRILFNKDSADYCINVHDVVKAVRHLKTGKSDGEEG